MSPIDFALAAGTVALLAVAPIAACLALGALIAKRRR